MCCSTAERECCSTAEVVVDHAKNICENLTKLLTSGKHSDVTFIITGDWEADHRIPAHRVILAAQSEYFDRLLFGEMREAHAGAEVTLPDTPLKAFKLLLKYAYCGEVITSDLEVPVIPESEWNFLSIDTNI